MTEAPSIAALQALGQSLAQTWEGRPIAERAAFARGLGIETPHPISVEVPSTASELPGVWADAGAGSVSAQTEPKLYPKAGAGAPKFAARAEGAWPETDLLAAAVAVERIAALSGSFSPAELVKGYAAAQASQLLDRLAPNFDRSGVPGAWSWTIKSERRAGILRDIGTELLAIELQRANSLDTDIAGRVLRQILSNGSPRDESAPLAAYALAYDWAAAARPDFSQSATELAREVSLNAMLGVFDRLLSEGFVGRKTEIARLQAFVRQPAGAPFPIPVLAVTGIGGSGKSTLLAQALRPLLHSAFSDDAAPMIVSVDFDRRSFLRGGEVELSFELSRQLGLYHPALALELATLREDIRRGRTRRGESFGGQLEAAVESVSRGGNEFEDNAGDLIRASDATKRRLVVVLDTFEEWQRGGVDSSSSDWTVVRILDWLTNVGESWGLAIRAIVSGRTPVPETSYLAAQKPIHLGDLKPAEAIQLLRQLGLSAAEARELAKLAGGSPLALKLAARYYRQLPAARRSAFVKDATAELAGVDTALRQGLLYQRFLNHIENAEARKVAHPGLALRRVTAELIREVLAQPCGLGNLDEWDAQNLLRLLGNEVWLVEYARRPAGEPWSPSTIALIHRPEIRRVMLRAMRTDPAQSERVRAVHRAAYEWYARKEPSDAESASEAIYHRLALAGPADFDAAIQDVPLTVLQHVADSADDFERAIRVRLLDHVGRRIGIADAPLLPAARRAEWADERADELVRGGQPERALDLWARLVDQEREPGAWHAAAAFQAQRWDEGIVQFLNEGSGRHASYRYHYLLAFVAGLVPSAGEEELRHLLPVLLRQQVDDPTRGTADPLVVESMYFSGVWGQLVVPQLKPERRIIRYGLLTTTQYLRVKAMIPGKFEVSGIDRILAGAFRPTEVFISEIIRRLEVSRGATQVFLQDLAGRIDGELPSAQILGAWSDRFVAAVLQDAETSSLDERRLAALLNGLMSDDPEWRVPIRTNLAEAGRDPRFAALLADHVYDVLGTWTPIDLRPEALTAQFRRSPRSAALKLVEYVDRSGLLPELLKRLSGDIFGQMPEMPHLTRRGPEQLSRIAREIHYLRRSASETANINRGRDQHRVLRLALICGLYLEWDARRRSFHESLE